MKASAMWVTNLRQLTVKPWGDDIGAADHIDL
jgi:hypothetical protein